MTTDEMLNAKDFTFTPFNPDVGGDSGVLQLTTHKSDSQLKYVVKSGYPELACNEFMYHHIAAALGLYTQEAKLITGIKGSKYAVGIRFVPNARKFVHEKANEDNKRIFYRFRMQFVILNEEDSEELFYDEHNRVFKLDNAASFNLGTSKVESVVKYGKKEPPIRVWQMLINKKRIKNRRSEGIVTMFEIKYVSENDRLFWFSLDKHLSENEFVLKIRDKRGYVISDGNNPVGVMRFNLFWDNTPFLTLIYIDEQYQGKGFGKQAMLHWENEMREFGYKMVMTSTQADEQAQHFYRKLGYLDRGCLVLDNTPYEQSQEIFMIKTIA